MTNGNEPAAPVLYDGFPMYLKDPMFDKQTENPVAFGLTKREYFAAMFTAAYITHHQNGNPLDAHGNADLGIVQADILIKELNKTNNENT